MTPPRKLTAESRIRGALRNLDLDDLGKDQAKDEVVRLRVSASEKQEIVATAEALGMTVSAYLLTLHREVREIARGR